MENLQTSHTGRTSVEPVSTAQMPVMDPATGKHVGSVMLGAGDTYKRTMEPGGKFSNLALADCGDMLEDRVTNTAGECSYNSGQRCNAPSCRWVECSCHDRALVIASRAAAPAAEGNPAQEGNQPAPAFDEILYDRVRAKIRRRIDERIRVANDKACVLAAHLQTADVAPADRVASQPRAGAVDVKGGTLNYALSLGRYKQSGNGREGDLLELEDYHEINTLHGFI